MGRNQCFAAIAAAILVLSGCGGTKQSQVDPALTKQLAEKDRRIAELERRLKRADLMLEIQKKAQEVLATFPERGQGSDGND